MKIPVCPKLTLSFSFFRKMSDVLIGVYDFDVWDISHEFVIAFMKDNRWCGSKYVEVIEREIFETLNTIQSSFHSAVNTFTAWEKKCDEIMGMKDDCESHCESHCSSYCKLNKYFAWVLRRKSTLASKELVRKHLILLNMWENCLNCLQQFKISRESCLADQYLQLIGLDSVKKQWTMLLKQKRFKHACTTLKPLESLQTILEEHWKSICTPSYWMNKAMVSHSSMNDQVQVKTVSKAIFAKSLIDSQYLVSPGQSLKCYEWRFIILLSLFHQPPTMPSFRKLQQ